MTCAGGSRGIGAAAAERLADDGAKVIINYSSNPQPADELVQAINAKHGKDHAKAIKADVGSEEGVASLAKETLAWSKHIDILFHCAAIMPPGLTYAKASGQDIDRVFAINVKGPLLLTQVR